MNYKSIDIKQFQIIITFLCTVIILNNNAYGMELITMCSMQTRPYYEMPGDVIAQIAACCSHKNTLMKLNKAWNKFCSKKNAANILIHNPLVLNVPDKQYFLNYYAHEGNQPIVINLLNNGADINCATYEGMCPLLCARDKPRNKKMINLLVNRGAERLTKEEKVAIPPLCKVIYYGKVGIVKSLVGLFKEDRNSQVGSHNMTPLMIASRWGNADIVKILLKRKTKVDLKDSEDWTALYYACGNGHFEVVRLLLKHKADITLLNQDSRIPLHGACDNGYFDIVQLLLDHNAHVNATDVYNYTPLHLACLNGYCDIVELLLSRGADTMLQDYAGGTPLHCACVKGHFDIVQLLLNHKVDVNVEKQDKLTPLHVACDNGHLAVVQLLLTHAANAYKEDRNGNTPLQLAFKNGHVHLVKFFAENMNALQEHKNLKEPGENSIVL